MYGAYVILNECRDYTVNLLDGSVFSCVAPMGIVLSYGLFEYAWTLGQDTMATAKIGCGDL